MSDLVQCPFDKSHQVAAKSLALHISKCQRQYPDVKLARCPLNASHLMEEHKLKEHVRNCPNRGEFELYKYTLSTMPASHFGAVDPAENLVYNTSPPRGSRPQALETTLEKDEECWDDYQYKPYDPLEQCKLKREQNKSFITPCANKFVGPNVNVVTVKKEFLNSEEEGRPALNEEVKSERSHSPERYTVIPENSENATDDTQNIIRCSQIKLEHADGQEPHSSYQGTNFGSNLYQRASRNEADGDGETRSYKSESNSNSNYGRAGHSRGFDRGSNRASYRPVRNMDRYDGNRYSSHQSYDRKSSRHSYNGDRQAKRTPYSRNDEQRRSNDHEGHAETSRKYIKRE